MNNPIKFKVESLSVASCTKTSLIILVRENIFISYVETSAQNTLRHKMHSSC